MYFINKSITIIAALSLANNSLALASPVRSENENEAKGLPSLKATHLLRSGLTVPFGKEEESMKQNVKRALERGTKNIFSRVLQEDCCCCSEEEDTSPTSPSIITSSSPVTPTVTPSHTPTASPSYSEKKFLASDGETNNYFGSSCSMTDDLVVIGAKNGNDYDGAAYLFSLDGTEVSKLEPEDIEFTNDKFGISVSIDEKIVVGNTESDYVRIFSSDGTYERTLSSDNRFSGFGTAVATLGNKIVTKDYTKLFIFTTDGDLLKEFDEEESTINDVAITNEYIVAATLTKTVVYSNVEPDFPLVREIEQGGENVAIAGDKLVIGDYTANGSVGNAWLYNIDGTLVKELEHDSDMYSGFGLSIAIANDKILVGSYGDDVGGGNHGSVFIYSTIDGAFQEKVLAPDAQENNRFGTSVCSNGLYFVVGAWGHDDYTGAGYLFNLPL